jgi:uncharacterized membrane protein YhhN
MTLLPRGHRALLVAYLVVAVVDVIADWLGPRWLDVATKPFLVLLLVAWVVAERRRHAPRLLVAGLVLAWLGDIALEGDGDLPFLLGLAFFLGMQVCYCWGFVRLGSVERLRRSPWLVVAAVVVWAGLNVALGPSLGVLRVPVLIYSAALFTMATLSLGVSTRVGVGGVVFLVSDLLIGLRAAGLEAPASGLLVMGTYVVAQLLIVTGWLEVDRHDDVTIDAPVAARG